jgi:hypothetical protein
VKILHTKLVDDSTYNQESHVFADGADFGVITSAVQLRTALVDYTVDTSRGTSTDDQWIEAYTNAREVGCSLVVTTPDGLEVLYEVSSK